MQDEDYYEDQDYGYTAEELEEMTWDAMTDGQYGPYPGGDIDYDMFGFWKIWWHEVLLEPQRWQIDSGVNCN